MTAIGFLSLAGVVAVVAANSLLRQAQGEIQGRLRNASLSRARHLLMGALLIWGGAGALVAFGTPKEAVAAAHVALPAEVVRGVAVQLQIDDEINYTGR
jgi:hypothetical protein